MALIVSLADFYCRKFLSVPVKAYEPPSMYPAMTSFAKLSTGENFSVTFFQQPRLGLMFSEKAQIRLKA